MPPCQEGSRQSLTLFATSSPSHPCSQNPVFHSGWMGTLHPGAGRIIQRLQEKLGKVYPLAGWEAKSMPVCLSLWRKVDPLTCPKCSGKMKVLSVIEEEGVTRLPFLWRVKAQASAQGIGPPRALEYDINYLANQLPELVRRPVGGSDNLSRAPRSNEWPPYQVRGTHTFTPSLPVCDRTQTSIPWFTRLRWAYTAWFLEWEGGLSGGVYLSSQDSIP